MGAELINKTLERRKKEPKKEKKKEKIKTTGFRIRQRTHPRYFFFFFFFIIVFTASRCMTHLEGASFKREANSSNKISI